MEAARHPWPALGILLLRDGLVEREELEEILAEQADGENRRITGRRLGELLVQRGRVTPEDVAKLVAEQYELPYVELDLADVDPHAARVIGEDDARRLSAIPISRRPDGTFVLAVADPSALLFSDELRRLLGSAPHFAVVGPAVLEAAIEAAWADGVPHDPYPTTTPEADEPDRDTILLSFPASSGSAFELLESRLETAVSDERSPLLGALLVRDGLLAEAELEAALAQQRLSPSLRLGEILVQRRLVSSSDVTRLVAEQYELPYVDLEAFEIAASAAVRLPEEIARGLVAVPIAEHADGTLEVAISDPTRTAFSDDLHDALGSPFTVVMAAPDAVTAVLDRVHAPTSTPAPVEVEAAAESPDEIPSFAFVLDAFATPWSEEPPFEVDDDADETAWAALLELVDALTGEEEVEPPLAEILGDALEDPVPGSESETEIEVDLDPEPRADAVVYELALPRLTEAPEPASSGADEDNVIELPRPTELADGALAAAVAEALAAGASTLHFSPDRDGVAVRARVDGALREVAAASPAESDELVARLAAEGTRHVHSLPTSRGEKTTLFVRTSADTATRFEELGLGAEGEAALRMALADAGGAIVVSGPRGSGVTTTLHALLEAASSPARMATTVERRSEREHGGVAQVEVDPASDATIGGVLRELRDADVDTILVGEVVDAETADLALAHAFEGRLVLAGIGAPSAAGALRRLAGMGFETAALSDAIRVVVGQRLVRSICGECGETYYASDDELAVLGLQVGGGPRLLARGAGCEACGGTGLHGRRAVFEVLAVTPEISELASSGASAAAIHRAALAAGMRPLRDEAVGLCLEGLTTAGEIARVLGASR